MRAHQFITDINEDISRRGFLGGLFGAGALGAGGVATKMAADNRDQQDAAEHQREMQRLQSQQQQAQQRNQNFVPSQYRPTLEKMAQQHGITSVGDLSNFLGQVEVETKKWTSPIENMNYSTPQLIASTFKTKFPTPVSAKPFVNNPVALANRAYAGVNGNGDEASGDGWRYRGRGFKQITGRYNYAMVGKWAHPDNPDIYVNNPDLLATNPRESALASIAYYLLRVKVGSTPGQASKRTNPGGLKKKERKDAMDKIQKQLRKQQGATQK